MVVADRPQLGREVLVVVAVLALCPLVAWIEPGSPADAVQRARDLLAVEGAIGLDVEAAAHGWVASTPPLLAVVEALYLGLHVSALVGVLLWLGATRPVAYWHVRNLFVASHLLTIALYLRAPTAPPRLLGDVDDGPHAVGGVLDHVQHPYAAVPSGHVVFAGVVAIGLQAAPSAAWRIAGAVYPPFVTVLVVVTGHHLLLDTVVAAAVVATAAGMCDALEAGSPRVAAARAT